MKRSRSDDLDVVVALPQRAFGGLTDHGKGLTLEIIEAGSVGEAFPKLHRLGPKLAIGELRDARLETVDALNDLMKFLQTLALADAQNFAED
jgi:hypothetical protein